MTDDNIRIFIGATNSSPRIARDFLERNDNDVNMAVDNYFERSCHFSHEPPLSNFDSDDKNCTAESLSYDDDDRDDFPFFGRESVRRHFLKPLEEFGDEIRRIEDITSSDDSDGCEPYNIKGDFFSCLEYNYILPDVEESAVREPPKKANNEKKSQYIDTQKEHNYIELVIYKNGYDIGGKFTGLSERDLKRFIKKLNSGVCPIKGDYNDINLIWKSDISHQHMFDLI